jgi:hypothetical protein
MGPVQDLVLEHRDGLAQAVLPDVRLEGLERRIVERREERSDRVGLQVFPNSDAHNIPSNADRVR